MIGTSINDYFSQNHELDDFDPKVHTITNLLRPFHIQPPYSKYRTTNDARLLMQNQLLSQRHRLHIKQQRSMIQSFRAVHPHSWIIDYDDFGSSDSDSSPTDTNYSQSDDEPPTKGRRRASQKKGPQSRSKKPHRLPKKRRTMDDFIARDSESSISEETETSMTSSFDTMSSSPAVGTRRMELRKNKNTRRNRKNNTESERTSSTSSSEETSSDSDYDDDKNRRSVLSPMIKEEVKEELSALHVDKKPEGFD